jgi:hypothetical protein
MLRGIITRVREVRNDTEFVVFINETKRGSSEMEASIKIFGVKASGIPPGGNLLGDVGTNRIGIIGCRGMIWRHVGRIETFIVTEMETVPDASQDV